jgi:hypothetical protein
MFARRFARCFPVHQHSLALSRVAGRVKSPHSKRRRSFCSWRESFLALPPLKTRQLMPQRQTVNVGAAAKAVDSLMHVIEAAGTKEIEEIILGTLVGTRFSRARLYYLNNNRLKPACAYPHHIDLEERFANNEVILERKDHPENKASFAVLDYQQPLVVSVDPSGPVTLIPFIDSDHISRIQIRYAPFRELFGRPDKYESFTLG